MPSAIEKLLLGSQNDFQMAFADYDESLLSCVFSQKYYIKRKTESGEN